MLRIREADRLDAVSAPRSQGMQAQIIKAVLSQALLFGIKDVLEKCKRFHALCIVGCDQFDRPDTNVAPPADVVLALILYARTSGRAVGVKV